MFERRSVWMFEGLSVWMFDRRSVWMFERRSVWMFERRSVWMFERRSVWMIKRRSIWMFKRHSNTTLNELSLPDPQWMTSERSIWMLKQHLFNLSVFAGVFRIHCSLYHNKPTRGVSHDFCCTKGDIYFYIYVLISLPLSL